MKANASLLWTALMGAALTTTLHAQTSAFTYQGHLIDSGSPASGTYDLRFAIYDLDTGGTEVAGPVTNSPVVVSDGLFTVTLDFGSTVFDGSPRWLDIAVRPGAGGGDFTSVAPRQPITSAPYAFKAANAASAASVAAGNITGTLPLTQLPAVLVTNGASGLNLSGTFSGDGGRDQCKPCLAQRLRCDHLGHLSSVFFSSSGYPSAIRRGGGL